MKQLCSSMQCESIFLLWSSFCCWLIFYRSLYKQLFPAWSDENQQGGNRSWTIPGVTITTDCKMLQELQSWENSSNKWTTYYFQLDFSCLSQRSPSNNCKNIQILFQNFECLFENVDKVFHKSNRQILFQHWKNPKIYLYLDKLWKKTSIWNFLLPLLANHWLIT